MRQVHFHQAHLLLHQYILLNIPLRVLTPEEESGQISLSGKDWEVLSEEDFAALKQGEKEASNPFAQLNGLFDDN